MCNEEEKRYEKILCALTNTIYFKTKFKKILLINALFLSSVQNQQLNICFISIRI
jgi:hypothetical protein